MKVFVRFLVALVFTATPLCGLAQQNYTDVSVYRVVKLRIMPGKDKDFYAAFAYAPKIWEAEKAAGLILGYQIFHSVSYAGPDKYDIMYVLHVKNMAVLDTFSDQAAPIVAKVYGSPEKRAEVAKLHDGSSEVVSSELIRDIELKPQM
jgi:hypothetical protein